MTLTKPGYKNRLVDKKIDQYLRVFGAISLEGPKWCGKTWTALNHAESATYLTDMSQRDLAMVDPRYIFTGQYPQLIDEWQIVPAVWDAVRHECDRDRHKGKMILTGSTTMRPEDGRGRVYHSGTGRIASLRMHPMSLWESGDSGGQASLLDMMAGHVREGFVRPVELDELARLIIRGGWPANLDVDTQDLGVIPASYLDSLVTKDMHENSTKKRHPEKMRMLLRSLARNEATVVSQQTLLRDMEDFQTQQDLIESRSTIADYLSVLDSLYLTLPQPAYSLNYRSSSRVGKSAKSHLIDPSLSAACLGLSVDKLLLDHQTFGLLFESLVTRDLRIYADFLDARLYHFRDNASGDEVDAIIEFADGNYATFEIKLSDGSIKDALASLQTFASHVHKKPLFQCVIVGHLAAVMRDPASGIFVVPVTSLRP